MAIAMTIATASESNAEICPLSLRKIMATSSTTSGRAAHAVDSHQWLEGSYPCIHVKTAGEPPSATARKGWMLSVNEIIMVGHRRECGIGIVAHYRLPGSQSKYVYGLTI